MDNDSREVFDKMIMSDLETYAEAKEMKFNFARLWFEKHMSQYGAFVPTEDGEFIIEFPVPTTHGKSLCDPSRVPAEGVIVNGIEFTMAELGVAYEVLNDVVPD